MQLKNCPDCGRSRFRYHHKDCLYSISAIGLMRKFREAERNGDDLTCFNILDEVKRRKLELNEIQKNEYESPVS